MVNSSALVFLFCPPLDGWGSEKDAILGWVPMRVGSPTDGTLGASLSTSAVTEATALAAFSRCPLRRSSMSRRAFASGSSTTTSLDRSLTPAMSRNAFESLSLSLYRIFWSSGCRPVFAATSFFTSPASFVRQPVITQMIAAAAAAAIITSSSDRIANWKARNKEGIDGY